MPRRTSSLTRSGCVCGVGQRQRRAPRAAEQLPALDPQVRAQPLHVGDQVPGGVVLEAGVRQRAAAAALVEQDDAIARRIVIAAHGGVAAAARSAVHDERPACRRGCRIPRSRSRARRRPSAVPAGRARSGDRDQAARVPTSLVTFPSCRLRLPPSRRAAMVTWPQATYASYPWQSRPPATSRQAGVRFLRRCRRISRSYSVSPPGTRTSRSMSSTWRRAPASSG